VLPVWPCRATAFAHPLLLLLLLPLAAPYASLLEA
jgi:hypothetical protein